MKLKLSLVFLSFTAVNASAFQAKLAPAEPVGTARLAQAQASFSHGYSATGLSAGLGQCDAASVSGCLCPFCTQLRSIGR
ncbi:MULTISPECIES: hypothetical protein [Dickeya]|nr:MULTISPECIES: hypothetical protein [Dickeya]